MKNLVGTKIGNVVNLVIDGNAFQKTFETQEQANAFYKLMHSAKNGEKGAIDKLMAELNRRYKTIVKGILEKDADENYYLKGIDIKLPQLLADTFVDYLDNDFPVNALVNFWKLLVTNPDPRIREDLFLFLQNYNFSITDNGYFIAYKSVEVKEAADLDIAAFVSNQYLKIKKWKKNVANYNVVKVTFTETEMVEKEVPNPDYEEFGDEWNEDEEEYEDGGDNGEPEYITEKVPVTKTVSDLRLVQVGHDINPESNETYEVLGNLAEMFQNIDRLINNRTVYQSVHRGKDGNKVEQVLGVPVKMDREHTDLDPKVECSSGLHVGSVKYVEKFGSQSNKVLLVLVNPAHVVAVPEYDNSKMRTCEYFPYAELERNADGTFEIVEQPYFEDDYMKYEAADLEKQIEAIQTEIEASNNPSQIQLDYKKILENRLVSIEEALAGK
jgi:hypothetical protein